jgi:hypothetical protein
LRCFSYPFPQSSHLVIPFAEDIKRDRTPYLRRQLADMIYGQPATDAAVATFQVADILLRQAKNRSQLGLRKTGATASEMQSFSERHPIKIVSLA